MDRLAVPSIALTALFVLSLVAAHPASASSAPVKIAILDTGIDASHPEFAPGQVVAWKDFVGSRASPYDDNGHGTGTASLVAGLDVANTGCGGTPKKSYSPGAPLIIGKVVNAGGSASFADIDAGIEWAIGEGASVISISLGAGVPLPDTQFAFIEARNAGVIVVVAAGNGVQDLGLVPYPQWLGDLGGEPGVIAVGGGTLAGGTLTSLTGNADPDVASWSDSVCIAHAGTTNYVKESGTSFSCPLVAGMTAHAISVARANGRPSDYVQVKRLVLTSATNSATSPYAREGMGWLLDTEAARMFANAAAGTLPNYDAQGEKAVLDHDYHDQVVEYWRG